MTLFGVEEASRQVKTLSENALKVLNNLNYKNEFLNELILEMASRRK